MPVVERDSRLSLMARSIIGYAAIPSMLERASAIALRISRASPVCSNGKISRSRYDSSTGTLLKIKLAFFNVQYAFGQKLAVAPAQHVRFFMAGFPTQPTAKRDNRDLSLLVRPELTFCDKF